VNISTLYSVPHLPLCSSLPSSYPSSDGLDFNSGSPQTVTFPAGVGGSTRCFGIEIIDDEFALEDTSTWAGGVGKLGCEVSKTLFKKYTLPSNCSAV